VTRGRVAATFWSRGKGLLGTTALEPGEGLLITPCHSIHSVGMRYRFDAIFVDRAGRARHLIHAMKPNRLSRHVFGAHGVLELPAGTIAATGTQPGDWLRLAPAEA
jgi:uncharacterized membrane protein (UPF0127 family)